MLDHSLAAPVVGFAWISLLMTLVPGLDTVLVLHESLRGGRPSGLLTGLGVATGVLAWGALTGLGVAVVLSRVTWLYLFIAVAGAVYLAWLAWTMIRSGLAARERVNERVPELPSILLEQGTVRTGWAAYRAGLTTNLLNPKVGLFYLSVIPGLFMGHDFTLWLGLLLGGIHAAWSALWLGLLALLAGWARRWLLRPVVQGVIDFAGGLLLLGFAAVVLLEVLKYL